MIQLLLLALALGVFVHDDPTAGLRGPAVGGWMLALAVAGPKLLLAGGYALGCRWTLRRLGRPGGVRALRRLGVLTLALTLGLLFLYASDLWLGLLRAARGADRQRDFILLDELAAMAPTLTVLAFGWWVYYPIERRLREATIFRRADEGLPIYPVPTRVQYVLNQARHHGGLILAPLLAIMAWAELVVEATNGGWITAEAAGVMTFAGSLGVFVLAPLVIRRLWDTVPLPAGPLRERLGSMCIEHRVVVRELLLWRTQGGMINAAVMGLAGPVRYILLTDALLEQVEPERVEAVMAHEIGHVRLRHLFTLMLAAAAGVVVLSAAGEAVDAAWPGLAWWAAAALVAVGAAGWVLAFGFVSRRVERQADTFAARHMAERHENPDRDAAGALLFDARSVHRMTGALQRVADLNNVPPKRPSWRHGSIASRQAYLRGLVGTPAAVASVDRVVHAITAVSGAVVAAAVVWWAVW